MKSQLTPFSKFLITLAIVAGLFFGIKWVLDNTAWGQSMKSKSDETTEQSSMPSGTYSDNKTATEDNVASASSSSEATASNSSTFEYVAPEPINGVLKGVVELGASGFNSFIVRIDKNKNWKLEKSEFGNSLVTENMATDDDIRIGLKKYIGTMLDYGVGGKNIHFVVSSGATKAEVTTRIIKALKSLGYYVNTVTPEQEGALALKCVLPKSFEDEAYVVDIGSGNTKISWVKNGGIAAFETFGAKYYQQGDDDGNVYKEVKRLCSDIPSNNRKTCFIIGGVPFQMAKEVRSGKERYTVLQAPSYYKLDDAKAKAGINIYKAIKDATGTETYVFDWDANFTIGFLLGLPS